MGKITKKPTPPPPAASKDEGEPIWGDLLTNFFGVHTPSIPAAAAPAQEDKQAPAPKRPDRRRPKP